MIALDRKQPEWVAPEKCVPRTHEETRRVARTLLAATVLELREGLAVGRREQGLDFVLVGSGGGFFAEVDVLGLRGKHTRMVSRGDHTVEKCRQRISSREGRVGTPSPARAGGSGIFVAMRER